MIKIKPTTKANGNKIRVQLFTSNAQKLPKSRVSFGSHRPEYPGQRGHTRGGSDKLKQHDHEQLGEISQIPIHRYNAANYSLP